MDQKQTETLSLKAAYTLGAEHGLQNEVDEIRNMVIEWDRPYSSSLRRGYIVALFEKRGVFDEFKASYWEYGNTPAGETKRRRYLRIKQQYESFIVSVVFGPSRRRVSNQGCCRKWAHR